MYFSTRRCEQLRRDLSAVNLSSVTAPVKALAWHIRALQAHLTCWGAADLSPHQIKHQEVQLTIA